MRKYITCILFVAACYFSKNVTAQELNLGMEEVEIYARPSMWGLGHDPEQAIVYELLADSVVKHGGHYSLKLTSNSTRAKFGSCYMQIALKPSGSTVTLKGFLKTENVQSGYGTLFLALCNDSTALQVDNLQQTGNVLKGTQNWKEFSVTLPSSKDVTKINLGCTLVGPGTVWVDDLTVLVDDQKITKAPVLHPELYDPKTGKLKKVK